ncbi:MAG: LptF/LptG family permease [Sphingobacteriaceae bacterium]
MRNFFRFKIIDRYIIQKYLGTFLFTTVIFAVIVVVFDISEKIDDFLKHNVSLSEIVFQYYAGFVPFYINFLSPLINFLAVIFFTAKMADQTEIVPILSGGVSFNRFLRPYFLSASLIFLVSFFANIYLIPYTNKLKITFENLYINTSDASKSEVHMQLDARTYVYVQSFNNDVHTGYQFVLEKFDGDIIKEKIVANRIVYDSLKRSWSIEDYSIRYVDGLKERMVSGIKKDTLLDLRPADFEVHNNVYDAMSMQELNKNIDKEAIRGTGNMVYLKLEKYKRFIYPLSSYVLTLIGVSISSRKVRGGIGLPLGIGIFLCFGYIITVQFANVFAIKGGLPPLIAVVIPNLTFGALGYYLLRNAPK